MKQPKEIAEELYLKFYEEIDGSSGDVIADKHAKNCAIICCDEIIKTETSIINSGGYWQAVKKELIK